MVQLGSGSKTPGDLRLPNYFIADYCIMLGLLYILIDFGHYF